MVREQTVNAKSEHHILTYYVVNRDHWVGLRQTAVGPGQTDIGNNEHYSFPSLQSGQPGPLGQSAADRQDGPWRTELC